MKKPKKTGPKPDQVKIEGDWTLAIAKAMKKKHPAGGWLDEQKTKNKKK